jgi:hypothetical protein
MLKQVLCQALGRALAVLGDQRRSVLHIKRTQLVQYPGKLHRINALESPTQQSCHTDTSYNRSNWVNKIYPIIAVIINLNFNIFLISIGY